MFNQNERHLLSSVVLETSPSPMVVISEDGKIVLVNQAVEDLFGYKREELLGKEMEILLPLKYQQDHPTHRLGYAKDPISRPMGQGRDLYGMHKDGHEIPVEVGLTPTFFDEKLFIISAIVNITERKNNEKALLERQKELSRSNQELEQFAYVTSHDLQAPLRQISSFAQFLEEDYRDTLDDKGKEFIERIVSGIHKMHTFINGLLLYSRAGSDLEKIEEWTLEESLSSALEYFTTIIEEKEVLIARDDLSNIKGPGVLLAQVFQNLIANSLKYTRAGVQPKIEIRREDLAKWVVIEVKDNGVGFDQKYEKRIFEIFKRLYDDEEFEGSGIGLAVCKRIIDNLGGNIWCESVPGEGSSFYFKLQKKEIDNK